ncbi:MAG: ABC transporter permease [Anaerolineales bacterium]|nr:ABC transporter permease [Anaerolineales bacterium]
MNPLSPFRYSLRHPRLMLALTALLALTVAGLYLFIGLAQETYIAPAFEISRYLSKFSLVQPNEAQTLAPETAARILASPDVARVLPQNDLRIKVTNIGGANFPFRLIGLKAEDVETVLSQSGVSLAEGRLPAPGSNEVALSREIAAALKLKLGDSFDRTTDGKAYANIVSPLVLRGILEGDVRLGILSYDFLAASESYRSLKAEGLLVIAGPGRGAAMEDYLLREVKSASIKTYTYASVSEQTAKDQKLLYLLGVPIVLLVSAAITLVLGAVNRLAFTRRLAEFGTLYALGRRRESLAARLALETAGPALAGWTLGILLGWIGLASVDAVLFSPRGYAIDVFAPVAIPFVTAVPLAVILSAVLSAYRALRRMDPVAVVERGQLAMEPEKNEFTGRNRSADPPRPLAPRTYYRRHGRQAGTLIASALLLILGTGLLFLLFAAGVDAMQPGLNVLSRMSAVSPNQGELDPALRGRIQSNPMVERAIEVYAFAPMKISIPPMFPSKPVETLCVGVEDLEYLAGLYGLELAEGRLPRPGTNEMAISWAAAKNRGLRVDDVLGDPDRPAYPGAPALPVQIVISGVFAPGKTTAEDTWLSFMSLEFVEPYRQSGRSLILVPQAGQKRAMDAWLEGEIAGEGRIVLTYANQRAAQNREMRSMLATFALMECVVALVAALALAGLHSLFLAGREAEMGVLNALGYARGKLAGRILGEALFLLSAAWAAAAAGCFLILLFLQYGVFAAAGLNLNFLNPVPWLATLPIPAAVLAACAALTVRRLGRMDPITVIERRM